MKKPSTSHNELLEAVIAITETKANDFALLIAALRGDAQTPPNYSRALRIICTAKGDDEFLDIIQVLAETLLAYQGSLDIRVNEQAGATQKAAIHYAAIGGNQKLYDLLVQNRADSELKDGTGTTAAQYLAKATRAKTSPVTPPTQTNSAPANNVDGFFRNMGGNDYDAKMQELLKVPQGDIQARGDLTTELCQAAEKMHIPFLDAFWESILKQEYVEAIRAVIRSKNVEGDILIKILLGYQKRLGFSINTQDPLTGRTPLHESITHRDSLELYNIMVGLGGDSTNIRDHQGNCANDLKREKFARAHLSAEGNPTTFINNLGINTTEAEQQPNPSSCQAPHAERGQI